MAMFVHKSAGNGIFVCLPYVCLFIFYVSLMLILFFEIFFWRYSLSSIETE